MARLSWDDHYKSSTYETWGSRHNKLQQYTISHYFDNPDVYTVSWAGSEVGTASTLTKAKALAAKGEKDRDARGLARWW